MFTRIPGVVLLVRELMEKQGYTQVYNVRHGITGWIAGNNPVVKN